MAIRADSPKPVADRLLELACRLDRIEGFSEVVAALGAGDAATVEGAWGSCCALLAAALARHVPACLVVVCPNADGADAFLDDLAIFSPEKAERFPAWDVLPEEQRSVDPVEGERTRLLKALLAGQGPRVLVTSIQALVQPVPSREELVRRTRRLAVGQEAEVGALVAWLAQSGFHRTSAVELPGEFSLRGGILDVFAPDWLEPVRIEFFGDRVESLRRFEVASQRSLAHLHEVEITLPQRTCGGASAGGGDGSGCWRSHLAEYLPDGSWFLLIEPSDLQDEGRQYIQRSGRAAVLHGVSEVLQQVVRFPSVAAWAVAPGTFETWCKLPVESVERFSGDIGKVRGELEAVGVGQEVFVLCPTEAEIQRLAALFAETRLACEGRLHFGLGQLTSGFRLVPEQVALVSSGELFHRSDVRRLPRRWLGKAIDSFLELREGDLVVHVNHGIARYRGMKLLEKDAQVEEYLVLEFEDQVKLYVPSSKIGLVQKYVGGAKARPKLARLGGRTWLRQRAAVEEAVTDLAAEMLELQAARKSRPGIAFPADTEWQREFDASFPYQETADQVTAMEAIKRDMCEPRPMDRLLCGDVGFGKTELAIRAAFKAVEAGYQVAVLVPTTVLAEQHARTFGARMAEYPIRIATLSRFATRGQQAEILRRLAAGEIDIVIGTHRLVQPDVAFRNLGLVIIDEEQRFGVEVKEKLKGFRTIVDVLTMTATPIPRTLHMALLGLRDISNLQTPPEDRLAVETRVTRFDPGLIRNAVLRELNRNGQVFFVHNRVCDIEPLARRLRQIVPEARIAIGHAQMPEHQLEQVMLDFVDRRYDLLLSTTIVESGLDIPNANTIFIDEADQYGLADLHQLRGRVGRYKHRAYCYLLIDPNKHLTPNAARRLRSIEEFSDLGAGFALAMRDLEIRGAGNILGVQQSGHIATVGYELYCQLLEQAVRRLKNLPPQALLEVEIDLPGQAYLPRSYVPGMREKIDLYRRLGRVTEPEELEDFAAELEDRFGPLPPEAGRLLAHARLRMLARPWLIDSIRLEEPYVVFGYLSTGFIRQLAARCQGELRIADARNAYLVLPQDVAGPDAILAHVEMVLHQPPGSH